MSKMYKKHYDLIAVTVAGLAGIMDRAQHFIMIQHFADALQGTSREYDRERFIGACNNAAAPESKSAAKLGTELHMQFQSLLNAGLDQATVLKVMSDRAQGRPDWMTGAKTVARNEYQTDEIEIDDAPLQSRGDDGVWVSAWVWVSDEDVEALVPEKKRELL